MSVSPPPPASPWSDLERPPLRAAALRRALVVDGGLWREVHVVADTGSTNADLTARARRGGPEGVVLVAEHQSGGRGRLGRGWSAPPRSGLAVSVLLRPGAGVAAARWSWLPLLAGLAVVDTVRGVAGVAAGLKWPNDVVVGGRKLAGVLAERGGGGADGAVVVGIGLNVTLGRGELPVPAATSLALEEAASTDREPLLRALLRALAERYGLWRDSAGDSAAGGLRGAYRAACTTLGREVVVHLPGPRKLRGTAVDVDGDGCLVVRTTTGTIAVRAGDVVHVR